MRRNSLAVSLFASLTLLFPLSAPRLSRAQKLASAAASAKSGSFDSLEQDVIREINLARTHPADYASYLEQMRQYFAGKELRRPGRPALVTQEGAAALEDAIKFLRAVKPAAPLGASTGMCLGARELVRDQGATGATGHKGADGSFCEQRTQRFGSWAGDIGEDLDYSNDTARDRVLMLLIDDGVANRGHRLRLLSPDYRVVGVACGNHKLGGMCVITFAGGFTDRPGSAQAGRKSDGDQRAPATKRF
jgi:uncharacterized protein YkwD